MLEIKILSGARAGQVDRFEQTVIVAGRHAVVDLRFSPEQDLDVSGRHAEIRLTNGKYVVHDVGSTNGTFVNGKKLEAGGDAELHDGDVIKFGAKGPEVQVAFAPSASRSGSQGAHRKAPNRSTEERIALAVSKHTAGLKRYVTVALLLVVAGVAAAYYVENRESKPDKLNKAIVGSTPPILQGGPVDSSVLHRIAIDLPAIHAKNSPAVALIVSEIGGKSFAGSAFAITPVGVLVTNRHNVRNENNEKATRIAVKFTNTGNWLPAHVVKVSESPDEDLALIQMDRGGPFPVVAGLSNGANDASEGMSVVAIGFPLGYDTPMEGEGNDFIAKSSLNPGTVSKRTSTVLQISSYAAHGSSGSPVFSARGYVIGVVYGGPREGNGAIVYAVPPDRLAAFVSPEYQSIVKP